MANGPSLGRDTLKLSLFACRNNPRPDAQILRGPTIEEKADEMERKVKKRKAPFSDGGGESGLKIQAPQRQRESLFSSFLSSGLLPWPKQSEIGGFPLLLPQF
jgi:hypothetical protein